MGHRESLAGVGLILNTGTAAWPKALCESYRVVRGYVFFRCQCRGMCGCRVLSECRVCGCGKCLYTYLYNGTFNASLTCAFKMISFNVSKGMSGLVIR